MQTQPTPTTDPRTEASRLVNLYATKEAALNLATAEVQAQLTAATAALHKIKAPHQLELDEIKAAAEELALKHGPEIFGTKRSFVENGWKLGLTAVEEVEMDADEQTVCRIVLRDLREVERKIEDAETAGDALRVQDLQYQRLALSSLLTIKYSVNKTYVKDNADDSADWFEMYGVRVVGRDSASLKKAPPSQAGKTAKKSAKLKTTEPAPQEAAA